MRWVVGMVGALALAVALPVQASLVINLDTVFSGDTPVGTTPWGVATFTDAGADTVNLTLDLTNLTAKWQITGVGLTEDSFDAKSNPAPGNGTTWTSAAHVQGIPDTENDGSSWIGGNPSNDTIPEPHDLRPANRLERARHRLHLRRQQYHPGPGRPHGHL